METQLNTLRAVVQKMWHKKNLALLCKCKCGEVAFLGEQYSSLYLDLSLFCLYVCLFFSVF